MLGWTVRQIYFDLVELVQTMRLSVLFAVCVITAILLFTSFQETKGSPSPRGGGARGGAVSRSGSRSSSSSSRRGGSRSGSSSSSSIYSGYIYPQYSGSSSSSNGRGSGSSSSSSRYSGGGSRYSSGSNRYNVGFSSSSTRARIQQIKNRSQHKSSSSSKKFTKLNLKKAVAYGSSAYLSYKASKKLRKSFKPKKYRSRYGVKVDVDFDDWENWMEVDGMLCRNDNDCNWLDANLGCNDYEFEPSSIRGDWVWKSKLRGKCTCSFGFKFIAYDAVCRSY